MIRNVEFKSMIGKYFAESILIPSSMFLFWIRNLSRFASDKVNTDVVMEES